MLNDEREPALEIAASISPRLRARARFFARRHLIPIAIGTGVVTGTAAGVFIVVLTAFEKPTMTLLAVTLVAFGIFAGAVANVMLMLTREKLADSDDIAAALAATTPHERPHFLCKIEERLGNRFWSSPMTTSQLVMMFDDVREEHGDRARQKRQNERRAKREQQRYIDELMNRNPGNFGSIKGTAQSLR